MELGHVLKALPNQSDPNLVGGDRFGDAAVFRLSASDAAIATIDFFTPIVDDPAAFGAIAAANSLSDIYARGGTPRFALSIVAFPRSELHSGLLEEIVAGGSRKLAEANVAVIGGHSVDDPVPKIGYAVVGEVSMDHVVSQIGARSGDILYLTKPIGTGIVTTAIKRGSCPPAVATEAVRMMSGLNNTAADAMIAAGVSAATDVSGFGLIGHVLNLRVGVEIDLRAVPVITGVRELTSTDLFPRGTRRNLDAFTGQVDWSSTSEFDQLLLCDAQTSGGILAAIPETQTATFESRMATSHYKPARIGRVVGGERVRILI